MKSKIFSLPVIKLLILTVSLSSCERKPIANFEIQNNTLRPGEDVIIVNQSIRANSFKWRINNIEYTTKEPKVVVPDSLVGKKMEFQLTATNKKKEDSKTLSLDVIQGYGDCIFYFLKDSTTIWSGKLSVTDGKSFSNEVKSYVLTDPNCGDPSCLNLSLPSGEKTFFFGNGKQIRTTIKPDMCNKIKIN